MSDTTVKQRSSQRADEFVSSFGKAKMLILKRIENLRLGDEKSADINSKLTVLSNDIQEMSTSLHDATLFLPSYSIKMRQEEIRELEKALRAKEDLLIPKKKFGFKAKMDIPLPPDIKSNDTNLTLDSAKFSASVVSAASTNFLTVENLSDQTLTYEDFQLNRNDVLIRNLERCVLYLHGSPSTLRLVNLVGCKLVCGPVFTSIFVEDCKNCVFFLCCQQLRVHSSDKLDFYLRVRSRAIIEDCTNTRFAPYNWNHAKSAELHALTDISENLERFDCVDDFNWLAFTTPSPNWSRVPEAERIINI